MATLRRGGAGIACDAPGDFLVQLHEGELGRLVVCHQQVELTLLGPHLGQIDMEVAD
jgi:hypothetical protein